MSDLKNKVWTYVGPSPSELSMFDNAHTTEAHELFEPASDLKTYLLLLIRAMTIKGYVFKPCAEWQEPYRFSSISSPFSVEYEPIYRFYEHRSGKITDTEKDKGYHVKDPAVFDLLVDVPYGKLFLDVLSMHVVPPQIVVYYDESGAMEYACEQFLFPCFQGFNLAKADDIVRLTYIATCQNSFKVDLHSPHRPLTESYDMTYQEVSDTIKKIEKDTVTTLCSQDKFCFYEQVMAMAIATHNNRPYLVTTKYAYPPNRINSSVVVDYVLAANLVNRTLSRFLSTYAFILISAIKCEKGLTLEGSDMPRIELQTRRYIMDDDCIEALDKGWHNDLKKVILNQAERVILYKTQDALL